MTVPNQPGSGPVLSRAAQDVAEGDRFYQVSDTSFVWVVDRVFLPKGLKTRHAAIVRDDNHYDRRIVATAALSDRTLFRPDQRDHTRPPAGALRRRRTDWPQRILPPGKRR